MVEFIKLLLPLVGIKSGLYNQIKDSISNIGVKIKERDYKRYELILEVTNTEVLEKIAATIKDATLLNIDNKLYIVLNCLQENKNKWKLVTSNKLDQLKLTEVTEYANILNFDSYLYLRKFIGHDKTYLKHKIRLALKSGTEEYKDLMAADLYRQSMHLSREKTKPTIILNEL